MAASRICLQMCCLTCCVALHNWAQYSNWDCLNNSPGIKALKKLQFSSRIYALKAKKKCRTVIHFFSKVIVAWPSAVALMTLCHTGCYQDASTENQAKSINIAQDIWQSLLLYFKTSFDLLPCFLCPIASVVFSWWWWTFTGAVSALLLAMFSTFNSPHVMMLTDTKWLLLPLCRTNIFLNALWHVAVGKWEPINYHWVMKSYCNMSIGL